MVGLCWSHLQTSGGDLRDKVVTGSTVGNEDVKGREGATKKKNMQRQFDVK